jgi:Icc-related predicted phosphoesterase
MKIVAISDTHTQHRRLKLPQADMIIHAGDISSRGEFSEILDFYQWFASLDYMYKIFIAGNHDFYFEKNSISDILKEIPPGITYLNDSGIEIEGLHIWGSPVQPWFYDWAFNRKRGSEIKKHWDMIPNNTDVLITHGPVYGVLDKTTRGEAVGCEELREKIFTINPRISVCGHIHEAHGQELIAQTKFINASVLDVRYRLVNAPILFEIEN